MNIVALRRRLDTVAATHARTRAHAQRRAQKLDELRAELACPARIEALVEVFADIFAHLTREQVIAAFVHKQQTDTFPDWFAQTAAGVAIVVQRLRADAARHNAAARAQGATRGGNDTHAISAGAPTHIAATRADETRIPPGTAVAHARVRVVRPRDGWY